MKGRARRGVWLMIPILAGGALAYFLLRESRIVVDTSKVTQGVLEVTVDEDGETRAHDRFVVASPIPGRLLRMEWEEGDEVHENSVVAVIEPLPLNQQQREEVLARIEAAEANKRTGDARLAHAREDHAQAERDLARAESLAKESVLSVQILEQARSQEATSAQELEAAKFSALAAASEVKVARAGLLGMDAVSGSNKILSLRSPVSGKILRLVEKSERVISAGTPLVVLGDPTKIEIVTDVLTTDGVNIRPGASVAVEGWGGDHPLRARVRLVEPSGFTKISALGVEEKRVNVISDFVDPHDKLGDGFRVEARIVTWRGENVLKIPGSAAFRNGNGWSAFVVENSRAVQRTVEIGHRNQLEVEILRGLNLGQEVIQHPSNQLRNGTRVRVN